jgi:hypothetical protein
MTILSSSRYDSKFYPHFIGNCGVDRLARTWVRADYFRASTPHCLVANPGKCSEEKLTIKTHVLLMINKENAE